MAVMTIIGWMLCCFGMAYITLAGAAIVWNHCGEYTIGGVPNKLATRLVCVIPIGIIIAGWYYIVVSGPFELVMK